MTLRSIDQNFDKLPTICQNFALPKITLYDIMVCDDESVRIQHDLQALEEPNFGVAYAQLCRVLSKVVVEVGTGPDVKKKTFRSLLLTKCQQEFEKDKESDKVISELKKKVEEASLEEKKQLEEELNEKEYRTRCNYLGCIRFIGELFKIKVTSCHGDQCKVMNSPCRCYQKE